MCHHETLCSGDCERKCGISPLVCPTFEYNLRHAAARAAADRLIGHRGEKAGRRHLLSLGHFGVKKLNFSPFLRSRNYYLSLILERRVPHERKTCQCETRQDAGCTSSLLVARTVDSVSPCISRWEV